MMNLSRSIICVLIALMLSSIPAGAAQTVYVSEEFEITLRTGPGNDNKILIQWVLTGGGIMLAGFFIGLFSAGPRRRRSSLY